MKQYMKSVMTTALMLLFVSGAWAADVNIKKQLNGVDNDAAGTVTSSISEGVCTLTVTPASGNYVTKDFITAYSSVTGNMAQTPRRDPGLDNELIEITASDDNTDPSGVTKYTFEMPEDGSNADVTVNFQSRKLLTLDMVEDIDDFIFNWEGHEPELTIIYKDADGEVELEENTDYTVELSDTVNAGTAKATITGKGIYTTISDGATSIVKTFTINPMDLSNEGIVGELTATNFEYDGEEHMPALGGISYNNHDLVNEVDYWLAYPDSVNAGTGMETEEGGAKGPRCEITGKGNFTGKVIRYYTIAQADFNVEIADIPEQTATGEPIEPELTVTFKNTNNKIIPVAASDYTADYSNNVNPGTATVILSSTGNNFKTELTQTKTFIINGIEDYLSIKDGEAFLSTLRVTNGNTFAIKDFYQVVCPEDIPATDLTWYSDDDNVVSVDNNGLITAEGYGNAKITLAYAGGGKYAEDTYVFYVDAVPKTPVISLPAGAYSEDQDAITMTKENVAGMAISFTWDDITGDNVATWKNYADDGVAFQEGTLSARVGYTFTKENDTYTVYSDTVSVAYSYSVSLDNIFASGQTFGTYCNKSTTTYKILDGVKAYIVTGVSNNKVTLAETKVLPPNTAVLLERGENATDFNYTSATDADGTLPSGNLLKYATNSVSTSDKTYYVLYKDEFLKATGTIPAGKCYLDLSGIGAARAVYGISHNEGDDTGISNVVFYENGVEKWYDLQGRHIEKPTKAGLYIKNGNKVVIER